jgi:hypothetical protein
MRTWTTLVYAHSILSLLTSHSSKLWYGKQRKTTNLGLLHTELGRKIALPKFRPLYHHWCRGLYAMKMLRNRNTGWNYKVWHILFNESSLSDYIRYFRALKHFSKSYILCSLFPTELTIHNDEGDFSVMLYRGLILSSFRFKMKPSKLNTQSFCSIAEKLSLIPSFPEVLQSSFNFSENCVANHRQCLQEAEFWPCDSSVCRIWFQDGILKSKSRIITLNCI